MNYNNLVFTMLGELPELRPAYEEEMQWLDEELPHVIFSMVLNPYLFDLLGSIDDVPKSILTRIFSFLEVMANSNDKKIEEVLVVTVLESLAMERAIIPEAKKLMGPNALVFLENMERSIGWTK